MVQKEEALILFGAAVRYPAFLSAIKSHGLAILVIDEPSPAMDKLINLHSNDPTHPLGQIDEIFLAEYQDQDSIMNKVDSWTHSYQIRGVYCVKDMLVEIAGFVADFLGVPSPGLRASMVCRNKHLQRLYLDEWSPKYVCIEPNRRNEIIQSFKSFPAVLKPVGRHSKSGIQLINDSEMLCYQLKNYPKDELLLLEEQVHGREFSIETLIQQGKIIFQNITQKADNESNSLYFIEMGHTVPACNLNSAETENLLKANQAILNRLQIEDGITHGEYRITNNGKVYLMEIAARNPGGFIKSLYYLATGQVMEPELIKISLGLKASYPKPVRYARQVYLPYKPGLLRDVLVEGIDTIAPFWVQENNGVRIPPVPSAIGSPPALRQIMVLKKRGEMLNEPIWNDDRCVSLLFDADTPKELDDLEAELRSRVMILTDPNKKE